MKCRHCNKNLVTQLIDLGAQPPSNSYLRFEDLDKPEVYLPLKVYVCSNCFLVQTADYAQKETFFNEEYAYFSSTSQTWLEHARKYVSDMTSRFKIDSSCFVMEVASNDGYLLQNFVNNKIPCLGIEPTKSTADVSSRLGIDTLVEFYGTETATRVRERYGPADLVTCNNVYAHVPDINDFTEALYTSLGDNGVVTIEFPHLLNLIDLCQFDTIYHEHYSYLSVATVQRIFMAHNLRIFDVEELNTHGGSVRIYGCKDTAVHPRSLKVDDIIEREAAGGLFDIETFERFSRKAIEIKFSFLEFLLECKRNGKTVCGYGAAAKGNTLINFAGVKSDSLPVVADAASSKIGKFLPGSRIPVIDPISLRNKKPDYVVVLPWNIADEIKLQLSDLQMRGCKLVTFVPHFKEV